MFYKRSYGSFSITRAILVILICMACLKCRCGHSRVSKGSTPYAENISNSPPPGPGTSPDSVSTNPTTHEPDTVSNKPTSITDDLINYAQKAGYNSLADVLVKLQNKGSINLKEDYPTILHEAAALGNEGIVQALLEQGADIKATDKNNKTAGQIASENKHQKIVDLIQEQNKARKKRLADALGSRSKKLKKTVSRENRNPLLAEVIKQREEDKAREEEKEKQSARIVAEKARKEAEEKKIEEERKNKKEFELKEKEEKAKKEAEEKARLEEERKNKEKFERKKKEEEAKEKARLEEERKNKKEFERKKKEEEAKEKARLEEERKNKEKFERKKKEEEAKEKARLEEERKCKEEIERKKKKEEAKEKARLEEERKNKEKFERKKKEEEAKEKARLEEERKRKEEVERKKKEKEAKEEAKEKARLEEERKRKEEVERKKKEEEAKKEAKEKARLEEERKRKEKAEHKEKDEKVEEKSCLEEEHEKFEEEEDLKKSTEGFKLKIVRLRARTVTSKTEERKSLTEQTERAGAIKEPIGASQEELTSATGQSKEEQKRKADGDIAPRAKVPGLKAKYAYLSPETTFPKKQKLATEEAKKLVGEWIVHIGKVQEPEDFSKDIKELEEGFIKLKKAKEKVLGKLVKNSIREPLELKEADYSKDLLNYQEEIERKERELAHVRNKLLEAENKLSAKSNYEQAIAEQLSLLRDKILYDDIVAYLLSYIDKAIMDDEIKKVKIEEFKNPYTAELLNKLSKELSPNTLKHLQEAANQKWHTVVDRLDKHVQLESEDITNLKSITEELSATVEKLENQLKTSEEGKRNSELLLEDLKTGSADEGGKQENDHAQLAFKSAEDKEEQIFRPSQTNFSTLSGNIEKLKDIERSLIDLRSKLRVASNQAKLALKRISEPDTDAIEELKEAYIQYYQEAKVEIESIQKDMQGKLSSTRWGLDSLTQAWNKKKQNKGLGISDQNSEEIIKPIKMPRINNNYLKAERALYTVLQRYKR
jgi:hypothetical protein